MRQNKTSFALGFCCMIEKNYRDIRKYTPIPNAPMPISAINAQNGTNIKVSNSPMAIRTGAALLLCLRLKRTKHRCIETASRCHFMREWGRKCERCIITAPSPSYAWDSPNGHPRYERLLPYLQPNDRSIDNYRKRACDTLAASTACPCTLRPFQEKFLIDPALRESYW